MCINKCIKIEMEVKGFPGYKIYPDGKVWSDKRKRYLRTRTNNSGYTCIDLYNDGKQKCFKLHRLVAQHYVSNPEDKPHVDHINRDKSDNRTENLRWVTRSENQQNIGKKSSNKIGHKNIAFFKTRYRPYRYRKQLGEIKIERYCHSLTEALCYKFIILLKTKSLLVSRYISS